MKLNPVSLSVQDDCSIGSKNLYSSVKLKCFTTLNGFPAPVSCNKKALNWSKNSLMYKSSQNEVHSSQPA